MFLGLIKIIFVQKQKLAFFLAFISLFYQAAAFAEPDYESYYEWLHFMHSDNYDQPEKKERWISLMNSIGVDIFSCVDIFSDYCRRDQARIMSSLESGKPNCFINEKLNIRGNCNGLAITWLYSKWLQFEHPENGDWFKETVTDILGKWSDCENIKKFITLVNYFQNTIEDREVRDKINKLVGQYDEEIHKEYSIMAPLDLAQLKQLLKNIVIYDHRLILISFSIDGSAAGHAVALFKDGANYYYFDANDSMGEIKSTNIDHIAKSILNSHDIFSEIKPVFTFSIFSFDRNKKTYPSEQEVLQKINASLSSSSDADVLLAAIQYDCLESLRYFLNKGVNVNVANKGGVTALMYAAAPQNNTEFVKLLLEKNANVDLVALGGYTALMMAVVYDNSEVVKLLLAQGAAINLADEDGRTALMWNIIDEIRVLPENYASDHLILKPFHKRVNTLEITKLLLEKNVDVDLVDRHNCTALMYAVEQNSVGIVKLLLEKNANIDLVNNNGFTALDIAKRYGHTEIIKAIENYRNKKEL